jgi:hypothetical protein
LEAFIAEAVVVEPTEEEQRLAAAIELLAQREGLWFDSGESQLCAVLITRAVPQLVTGDKRAIAALERLLDLEHRLDTAQGRVWCLEQLIWLLIDRTGIQQVRAAVCAEPHVDRALAMCFSCGSGIESAETVLEGLASYIRHLREMARRVLAASP